MTSFGEYWDREAIRLLGAENKVPDLVERCRHAYEAGWKAAHEELEQEQLSRALKEAGQKLREKSVQYREWKQANGYL
jgi:hypothetical protein